MKNKELYQQTFSQIHTSVQIGQEIMLPKKRRHMRPVTVLAAAIVLATLLSVTAAAARYFSLRSLELARGEGSGAAVPTGIISLSGYGDIPEKRALEEWQDFLANYDDGGLLDRLGNSPSGFEEKYGLYFVYSQEMADKLEEIVVKYGLKLHTHMLDDLYTNEALCAQIGGDFLGENRTGSTYMYEDGTFHFDGDIQLAGYGHLDYQFMRCVRGSFNDVFLNIGNVDEYEEWTYTTDCGVPVTLALSAHKGLIVADLADSLVSINVLAGTQTAREDVFSSGPLSKEKLEAFADSFDFRVLTPARLAEPALPRPSLEEVLGKSTREEFEQRSGMSEPQAQQFYAQFLALIERDDRQAVLEQIFYPVYLTVEEGVYLAESPAQLLSHYDVIFTEGLWDAIQSNQYDKERADLFARSGMVGAAGGALWFARTQDGRTGVLTIQNSEGCSIRSLDRDL